MIDDRVPDGSAASGHDVELTGREPALVEQDPRERERREGSLARGLQHDRTPGRDRGRELVRDEIEREIEWADRADHTDRNSQCERELAFARGAGVHRNDIAGERAGRDGGERERRDAPLGFDPRRLDRLGGLRRDDACELLDALRHDRRGAIEDLGAFPGGERAGFERGLRRGHRGVDLLRAARGDPAEQLAVVRRAYLDPLAGRDRRVADREVPVSHTPMVRRDELRRGRDAAPGCG
jgi:hypothetical protein